MKFAFLLNQVEAKLSREIDTWAANLELLFLSFSPDFLFLSSFSGKKKNVSRHLTVFFRSPCVCHKKEKRRERRRRERRRRERRRREKRRRSGQRSALARDEREREKRETRETRRDLDLRLVCV